MGSNSAPGGGWQAGLKAGSSGEKQWKEAPEGGAGHAAGLHLEEGTGGQPGTFGVG